MCERDTVDRRRRHRGPTRPGLTRAARRSGQSRGAGHRTAHLPYGPASRASRRDVYETVYERNRLPFEIASGCVETAETVSVDVDQPVELVPEVEGTNERSCFQATRPSRPAARCVQAVHSGSGMGPAIDHRFGLHEQPHEANEECYRDARDQRVVVVRHRACEPIVRSRRCQRWFILVRHHCHVRAQLSDGRQTVFPQTEPLHRPRQTQMPAAKRESVGRRTGT